MSQQQDEKLFGEIAVSEGHITPEQLQECQSLQTQSGDEKALWQILVEKSYLDHHSTNQLLDKVKRKKTSIRSKRKVAKFFGDIAVARGFCTAEQMDEVLAEQRRRMESGHNQRFGELSVEMGVLDLRQVAQILEEQNRSVVLCEGCGSAYNVEGFAAGKRWRCKVCNAMLEVPGGPAFASIPIEELASERFDDTEKVLAEDGSTLEVETAVPARPEKTRFGNYYILEKVARGGMGIIYKARQRGLDRIVALKVLIAGESASEETIERFYLEAKSAAKLRHPNIVPIHEVGIHDDKHFFTMDFIHGDNLRYIILNQKINTHWALELTAKVARALHYAHEHGIVHRDIKPENILIDETGEPQVTDFGLAVDVEMDANLTRAGVVMGTPAYMSPEQARGERSTIDHRSDVYSLGAVLYEMLTGQQVFKFEGPIGLKSLMKTFSEDPVLPRRINPRIPREVETIVVKALEKDQERRYQSAEEFAEDIGRYLTGEPILAKRASFTYRTWKKIKKYKVVSISMLSAIVAITAVTVYFINQGIEARKLQDRQFHNYISEAGRLLSESEFLKAKTRYDMAKALRPQDPEVTRGLIKVQVALAEKEKSREKEEAKKRASQAAASGKEMLERAREALKAGKRFEAKNEFFDAIREFDRALMDDKTNRDARQSKYFAAVELGNLYMRDKDYGVAVFVFSFAEGLGIDDEKAKELVLGAQKARQKAEEFEMLLVKANKFLADASWDEALRHLQLARKFEGISQEEKHDIDNRVKEASYSRYFWEGESKRKEGKTSAAIEAYVKAESFKETPEIAERLRSVRYDRMVRKAGDHLARKEYREVLKAYLSAEKYASNPAEITELIEQCRDRGFNHYIDLAMTTKASGDWTESIDQLKQALFFRPEDQRARKLKAEVSAAASCPQDMVFVFSGKFTIGSAAPDDRSPLREVFVDFFYIDKFEVTNRSYKAFVDADGYSEEKYWDPEGFEQAKAFVDRTDKPGPATWENGAFPQGKEKFPVTGISWFEARAYARWAGKRLPTEEEWEKAASYDAATGTKFTYPWGDEWNPGHGNFRDDEPTKVGSFRKDVSPAGCFDMGGNAFEWTSSSYKDSYRVIRGGSVGLSEGTLKRFARVTKKKCPKPTYRSGTTGFRCALTPEK